MLSRFKVLLVILVSLFAIWWFGRPLVEVYKRVSRIDTLSFEVATLRSERDKLSADLEYYRSLAFVEKEARNRFNFSRPGETVVIVPEEGEDILGEQTTHLEEKTISNWKAWYNLFFE